MAEAICLYFPNTPRVQLDTELDCIARRVDRASWEYPKVGQRTISIYYYEDLLNEFEDEQLNGLLNKLGTFPESIICLEYHASRGDLTSEHAASVAIQLLKLFPGLTDDLHGNYWSLAEIEGNERKGQYTFAGATHYSSPGKPGRRAALRK